MLFRTFLHTDVDLQRNRSLSPLETRNESRKSKKARFVKDQETECIAAALNRVVEGIEKMAREAREDRSALTDVMRELLVELQQAC